MEGPRGARGRGSRGDRATAYPTNDAVSGALNPFGINVLRSFPGAGLVVWGARTLGGSDIRDDPFKYVPVRRLTDYLEASLYLGTQFAVFEPNDPELWGQLRLAVGGFMRGLFRQGAFQQSESRRRVRQLLRHLRQHASTRRPRSTPGESTSSSASRRSSPPSSSSSPSPRSSSLEPEMAEFTVNPHALRPVQDPHVPREVGRRVRRGAVEDGSAHPHDGAGDAPGRRRPDPRPAQSRPDHLQRGDAGTRGHPRPGLRGVGEQGVQP